MKKKYKKKTGVSSHHAGFNFREAWKLWLVLALLVFNFTPGLRAQTTDLSGNVRSAEDGTPLPGVTVRVRGTIIGTVTNDEGRFVIRAVPGDTLDFSSVGYYTQTRIFTGDQALMIQLKKNFSELDQLVVVGYGEMKKRDLSSAQVTVTNAEINRTINTTFDQALQGRAANVEVTSNSGQPGAAPSVIIRGLGTLTQNAQPLYVIDGVQITTANPADDPNNHPTGFSNVLSSINPDDIATINILQGPSATAIFGAAGANGVIMITTKHGSAGKTKISVSSLLTLQDKPRHISVMNLQQYAAFRNAMASAGGTGSEPQFADPTVLGPGTDWQDVLYRRTMLQKDEFSLSGGNDKTTFYFSGGYFNQEGIVPGSGFKRYSTRLNLTNQTRKWLKMGTNLSVGFTKEKVNTTNGGIINLALQQNPSVPAKNPDGSWGGPATAQFQYTNPLMIASIYNDYNKRLSFLGSAYADITPIKGLIFHNEVDMGAEYYNYYSYHPGYQAGAFIVTQDNATSTRTATNNYWWSINNRLQYSFNIHKNAFTVMVAHEAKSGTYESLSGNRKDYLTNDVQELSAGDNTVLSNIGNTSSKNDWAQESYFGRLNYEFNNKYILQATYRADASSNFGPNNKWGYFPSLSVAWRISNEDFLKDVKAIDDLKLRFEIGESGNAGSGGGIYAALQTVPTPGGIGFLSQKFPNPYLRWETDKTVNVGFDLHMFDSRLEVIADAYVKNSTNLITVNTYPFTLGGDISYSSGYIQWPTVNAGSIRNKGLGITVNTVNIDNAKGFSWRTGLNFSLDRNKITSLLNTINPAWNASQVEFVSKVGQPASMITGYIAEGLFQNYKDITGHAIQTANGTMTVSPSQGSWVGDIKFKDLNGDGLINQDDRTIIGNPWPKFTFGFNNSFSYKNFDLNVFITGSVGNDILNYPRYTMEIPGNTGTFGNYYTSVNHFARPSSYADSASTTAVLQNPGYKIPRVAPGDPNGNNRMSQWFVEDGSYVRVKNVTLSYTFPHKWISHLAMTNLKLSASVQNLLTITGYKGYDPEVGMVQYSNTLMVGVDTGRYPTVRFYSFSLSANF
ncbi:MAG TPA: TonB-dependent receptor [Chitinophagaceae bacterium]|nr:TonB-dependent receptor [Chitinophagaceae bacterium]